MKRSPLLRKTALTRSGRIKRRSWIKAVNRVRSAEEFQRAYGGEEYINFVHCYPCLNCNIEGFTECAHTENEGKGRKGHHSTIVPLCGTRGSTLGCHQKYDLHEAPFNRMTVRERVRGFAAVVFLKFNVTNGRR